MAEQKASNFNLIIVVAIVAIVAIFALVILFSTNQGNIVGQSNMDFSMNPERTASDSNVAGRGFWGGEGLNVPSGMGEDEEVTCERCSNCENLLEICERQLERGKEGGCPTCGWGPPCDDYYGSEERGESGCYWIEDECALLNCISTY